MRNAIEFRKSTLMGSIVTTLCEYIQVTGIRKITRKLK